MALTNRYPEHWIHLVLDLAPDLDTRAGRSRLSDVKVMRRLDERLTTLLERVVTDFEAGIVARLAQPASAS